MLALLSILGAIPHATALTPPSILPGDAAVGQAAGDQFDPVLVRGENSWLLVWQDTRASLAGTLGHANPIDGPDIYAIRLGEDGVPLDSVAFPVTSSPWFEGAARAGWNGTDWLVAFNGDQPTTSYFGQDVLAVRVSGAGAVRDGTPIAIVEAEDADEALWDVASDGASWAVVWQDVDASSYVLDGLVVAADGTVGAPVRVHTPAYNLMSPWNARLAWATDRYLLAWDRWGTTSSDVVGLLADRDLGALGSAFVIGDRSSDDVFPSVATDGSDFYVAWADHGVGGYWGSVRGTPVSRDGTVAVADGANLTGASYPLDPHPDLAWAGERWAVAWENWSASDGYQLYATWADPDGGGIETQSLAGGTSDSSYVVTPAVASADAGALTAWVELPTFDGWAYGRDLLAAPLDADGTVGTPVDVALGAPAQTNPEIAGDSSGYLLVARSEKATEASILAWRLDAGGVPVDTGPIEIATGGGEVRNPAVAWNGEVYLVVWEIYDTTEASSLVRGVRVDPDGTVLDATPLDLLNGNTPAVAASGGDFLVAASYLYMHEERSIEAVRVDADGGLLDAEPFTLGWSFATLPDVAGTNSGWMVAWQRAFTHDSPYTEAKAVVVGMEGTPGTEFLARSYSATPVQTGVSVASAGATALLTWSDGGDIRGRRVTATGTRLGIASGIHIADQPNTQFDTDAAWTGTSFAVAWTDWRIHTGVEPGEGDVFAATVLPTGKVVTKGGRIATDRTVPEGNVAVGGALGTVIYAYTKLHEEAPYAAFRIETVAGP
jgi:hypothetical protein